jgi:hypothetical protein
MMVKSMETVITVRNTQIHKNVIWQDADFEYLNFSAIIINSNISVSTYKL